jgi:predicted outer membrane repeat protein
MPHHDNEGMTAFRTARKLPGLYDVRPEVPPMYRRSLWSGGAAVAIVLLACGNSKQATTNCNTTASCFDAGTIGDANLGDGTGNGGGEGDASDSGMGSGVDVSHGPPLPGPQPTCNVPIQPANTTQPTVTLGIMGTQCTEQDLRTAVAKGGIIKFYCPMSPTITVTQTIQLPTNMDVTIDGGNVVTLDGGGTPDGGTGVRILSFNGPGNRATKTTVTLQNISFTNGNATGTPLPMTSCSQGTGTDGGGGAIYVKDGILHVINAAFTSNQAAPLGPDVGGGAIYAEGSLDITVVNSQFTANGASNGGAIASLNSDLTLVKDQFNNNNAKGSSANAMSCSVDGGQVGNGGNGGAVAIHGGSDGTVTICGCNFGHNKAGALGGAVSRSADSMMQTVNIDQGTFDTNTAAQGGGAVYVHNVGLSLTASTLSMNSAPGAGAVQTDATQVNLVNDTFWNNSATTGTGGAMTVNGNGGTVQSCTFAENHADHVTGGSAAAIAGAMLTINDTLFWHNQTMDCMSPMTCQNTANTGQANMQWPDRHMICTDPDPPCTSSGTTFMEAMLKPLGLNGGPTRTMVPMAGSPAIGAGKSCPMSDQRGVMRNPNGCTIGAVEAQ